MQIDQKLWDAYTFYKNNKEAVIVYIAKADLTLFSSSKTYEENIQNLLEINSIDLKAYSLRIKLRFFAAEILHRAMGELHEDIEITELDDDGLPNKKNKYFDAYFNIKNKNGVKTFIELDLDSLRLVVKGTYAKGLEEFFTNSNGCNKENIATSIIIEPLKTDQDIERLIEDLKTPAQKFLLRFKDVKTDDESANSDEWKH